MGVCRWVIYAAAALASPAHAQSETDGLRLCEEIGQAVRALVDFTQTECHFGANDDGGLDLILVSSQPVSAAPAAWKAWAIVSVVATAEATRKSSAKTGRLVLSDSTMIGDAKGRAITTAAARSIQSRVKSDTITLDQAVKEMNAALIPFEVKR